MTTPAGTITMGDVNTELGISATAAITLNDSKVRALAGVPTGAISLDNLRSQKMIWYPSACAEYNAVTGGTYTAYTATHGKVAHSTSGTLGQEESMRFSGFGSGTVSGYINLVMTGNVQDNAGTESSAVIMYINYAWTAEVDSNLAGTPKAISFTAGSPLSVYIGSCNLASLTIVISATGGTDGTNNCYSTLTVTNIYFSRTTP